MVIEWSFHGHQTWDTQIYHWCELSNKRILPVSPILFRSLHQGEAESARLWFSKKGDDHRHLQTFPEASPQVRLTANDRPHWWAPCHGNNFISPCPVNHRWNFHTWRVLGMKSFSSIPCAPGSDRDTGDSPPGHTLFCSLLSSLACEYNHHLLSLPVPILKASQSLDHVHINIIITPGQRKKVSNKRIPNMFTRQKDRKETKPSS